MKTSKELLEKFRKMIREELAALHDIQRKMDHLILSRSGEPYYDSPLAGESQENIAHWDEEEAIPRE